MSVRSLPLKIAVLAFLLFGLSTLARAQSLKDVTNAIRGYRYEPVSREQMLEWRTQKKPFFVEIVHLHNSQNRLSFDRVHSKIVDLLHEYNVAWNGGEPSLPYADHTSLIPMSTEPGKETIIPVALMPNGELALIDGHHEVVASLAAKATKIPVRIVLDLSKMSSNKAAWKVLVRKKLAYLKNIDGSHTEEPVPLNEVQDDPLRGAASQITKRIETVVNGDEIRLQSQDLPQDVVVKLDHGIPFIEFEIADILYAAGFKWDPKWAEKIPQKEVERIRKILLKAKADGNPVLKNVALIEARAPSGGHAVDPNIVLAKKMGATLKTNSKETKVKDVKGPKFPIFVSFRDSKDNARVEVARALYKSGVVYNPANEGAISNATVEQHRKALATFQRENPQETRDAAIITMRTSKNSLDGSSLLKKLRTLCRIKFAF